MGNRIRQPVHKGVARVPVVMQLEALECGAASLAMILAYYGKWIPLEKVRADCGVCRDGSNARDVLLAARHYGLEAQGFRFEPEILREKGSFPCIVHWEFNHFVVLKGFKNGKACLNDPARGSYSVSMQRFDEAFTGVCLLFQPGESFVPDGKQESMLSFARRRLRGSETALIFAVLTGVITALMSGISPAFSRVFLDRLLTGQNPQWLPWFLALLGAFDLILIFMSALQAVYNLRINGKMAAVGNATYMWKVLHIPMTFFSQRMAGDIQSRQSANATIANTLINTFAPLVLNAVMMVFYLVVMLRYSWILTVVGLVTLLGNALVSRLISKKRINIMRVSTRDAAKLAAATVSGFEMIETMKASGAEVGFFSRWSGYQAGVNAQQVRFFKLNQYLGMIPQFLSTLADDAVLILGVWLCMLGEFTPGKIMAFQGFLSLFMAPATTMISAGQTIMEMRTQMERVDDVMQYPEEAVFAPEKPEERLGRKLSGRVEVKNLVFGYAPLAQPVIRDFDLSLEPGRSVAIVGGSGCGKSTVSKLLSGLYTPWSGEILFDGKPLCELQADQFRASVAVVDQDVILFEDTIANNIKMWDNSIEDFEMILAARDAQLHEDIMQRPDGYQYRLTEGGKDFSGGQRQRMEIARVLAQDPSIVILDEATSALDAQTEYNVVRAIRERGITSIVIAHRLSTIRSCDEIIVLDKGRIVDRGTHAQLMEHCELYRDLVSAE